MIVVFGSFVVRMSEVPLGADGLAGWFNRDAQIEYVQMLSIHKKNEEGRGFKGKANRIVHRYDSMGRSVGWFVSSWLLCVPLTFTRSTL